MRLTRRSELWRNLSLTSVPCKSRTPSHSSGKLCNYDSEGRSERMKGEEKNKTNLRLLRDQLKAGSKVGNWEPTLLCLLIQLQLLMLRLYKLKPHERQREREREREREAVQCKNGLPTMYHYS